MKTNEDLRSAVQDAIEWNWEIPDTLTSVNVGERKVNLEGEMNELRKS
ncbi:MAG: hypothetical protein NW218_21570 [Saprospiraceae bacterium]|jgi:hypothetical protein|nr:hypothetical protein [Saprospiraceae bacterium]